MGPFSSQQGKCQSKAPREATTPAASDHSSYLRSVIFFMISEIFGDGLGLVKPPSSSKIVQINRRKKCIYIYSFIYVYPWKFTWFTWKSAPRKGDHFWVSMLVLGSALMIYCWYLKTMSWLMIELTFCHHFGVEISSCSHVCSEVWRVEGLEAFVSQEPLLIAPKMRKSLYQKFISKKTLHLVSNSSPKRHLPTNISM